MSRHDKGIPTSDLVRTAVEIVESERVRILDALNKLDANPDSAASNFVKRVIETKLALQIDLDAEVRCRNKFLETFPEDVQFVGEESLANFKEWGQERYCIIVDMVDGTDLVEMNLGLWCSAIVIYDQRNRAIIGSVVGLSTGETYHAESDREGARVRFRNTEYVVDGTSSIDTLEGARLAFYGQKPKNFLSVANNIRFQERLGEISKLDRGFRIYNFAGNPMMVKLCNRPKTMVGKTITDDIDLVFDVLGQNLHDVVPGAFIAMKGGAFLFDMNGGLISVKTLGESLHNPNNTLSYVLSATEALGNEMCQLMS